MPSGTPNADQLLAVIHESLLREISIMRVEITARLDDLAGEIRAHLKEDDRRFAQVFRYIYLALGAGAILMWSAERGLQILMK